MKTFFNQNTPTLGLGCWAIGGPFFAGDRAVGWGEVNDATSTRAIHTAVDQGIRFFDTAQAYGTGHSETVLGAALKQHPEVAIATKVGIAIDPVTKQIDDSLTDPAAIEETIRESHKRLQRDHIDLILLHPNEVPLEKAEPIFDMLDRLFSVGTIGGYGWSTDFPERATAFADRPGFLAVEHAMNVFFRAEHMVPVVEDTRVTGLIRSPLAMGILGGRYDSQSRFSKDEIRGGPDDYNDYFRDGRINETYVTRLDAVREILTSNGRSLAQGAIAWLWARSDHAVPIPGFRTPEQVQDLCGAIAHGPLAPEQMADIEAIMDRPPEGPPRAR